MPDRRPKDLPPYMWALDMGFRHCGATSRRQPVAPCSNAKDAALNHEIDILRCSCNMPLLDRARQEGGIRLGGSAT